MKLEARGKYDEIKIIAWKYASVYSCHEFSASIQFSLCISLSSLSSLYLYVDLILLEKSVWERKKSLFHSLFAVQILEAQNERVSPQKWVKNTLRSENVREKSCTFMLFVSPSNHNHRCCRRHSRTNILKLVKTNWIVNQRQDVQCLRS